VPSAFLVDVTARFERQIIQNTLNVGWNFHYSTTMPLPSSTWPISQIGRSSCLARSVNFDVDFLGYAQEEAAAGLWIEQQHLMRLIYACRKVNLVAKKRRLSAAPPGNAPMAAYFSRRI
jgi:hypothetical protein